LLSRGAGRHRDVMVRSSRRPQIHIAGVSGAQVPGS